MIEFHAIQFGNTSGQYAVGPLPFGSRYTAAFPQELNIHLSMGFFIPNNHRGEIRLTKTPGGGGLTTLRSHIINNFDNKAGNSQVPVNQTYQVSIKTRLIAGDFINLFAFMVPAGGAAVPGQTTPLPLLDKVTNIEFEIIRAL